MKIGNYTDDEILEFMTEGEGRSFLGRSMFDAMYFEIDRLNNIINNDFSKICREKMIDKLSANEMILLQNKEIERLNNIINELEKWLDETKSGDISFAYSHTLNKLKELKEKNND